MKMPVSSTPKQRKRTPKSCLNCRRRKLKCDRQHPCSRCKERYERCLYAEGPENEDASPEANDQLRRTNSREAVNSAASSGKKPSRTIETEQKRFEFYGWRTFLELVRSKKPDDRSSFHFRCLERNNTRMSVPLHEEMYALFPPYCISKSLVEHFLDTTNELFPIFYRPEIGKYLMLMQTSGLRSIPSDGIFLLLCIIGHALEMINLPLEVKNYFATNDCSPADLSKLIFEKLDEFFNNFQYSENTGNVTRIQYFIAQALYNTKKQLRGCNVALCRSVHLSIHVSPIYQLDNVTNDLNTDLWLTICEIDAMEHIFKSRNCWVQRDVFGRLQPARNLFSDEKTFQYHSLLGKLLNCGLDVQKAVHTLTVQEYLRKLDEFDVGLSLILTSIESLFFGVSDLSNIFRYDFLRLIFWIIRKNLYQCFLTVEQEKLPEPHQIFEKLAIACIQACRITTSSYENFIRFDLLGIATLESITCLLILPFCQERGFQLPNDCTEMVYTIKNLNSIIVNEDPVREGIEYMLDFILSALESNSSNPSESESDYFIDDPLKVFSDMFNIPPSFFLPHGAPY
ncbi:fungal Zn(2)-Cys(6) binuclear cluster domain-containing protein [Schizosaccharomyces cryophilus OY26]|uniref:Fungal Zn(2)-Cys(6) binuclear cluster domain-containing protein n=1 Tax=Schizosaccharomyces cryophilus (strain OY26 / ATCC MYA-4695 / CBS 11777 / NBRC 106824 / NRRL Y48691) TaxID=653667 RepID=S9W6L4_SCHCR|nr:fungal Zn(2)-Cys(6) binuclear cluster domain-containing protein [Schizosaccharomyces cryophilus OY26]EPY54174.1 fungal Zn(2)-Cys(6) binuclear cluster domain-containing protein [Schizosaccharomyces cryophilus OY26]